MTELSIVIPAYNEENRIQHTIQKIKTFLHNQSFTCEIIIVDDGSTDNTVAVCEASLRGTNHSVVRQDRNRGKGAAVKTGMLMAKGKYCLFSDADLSTPIEEVLRFIELHNAGNDVVIGSRAMPDSKIEVRQNPLRELMGKTFNRIAQLFSFQDIHDSQCGFKSFTHDAAKKLFSLQHIEGFAFDAEIIYLAQRLEYKVIEQPVQWFNSPQSKVNILLDPLKMLVEIMKIKWIHRSLPLK